MSFLHSWTSLRQLLRIASHPKLLATKTRLANFPPVRFLLQVLDDYATVTKESLLEAKNRPTKTALILSILTAAFVAHKTNPSQMHFHDICLDHANDLIQVPHHARKAESTRYLRHVHVLRNQNRLEFQNWGIFSLVLRRDFGVNCDVYEARCRYLQPRLEDVLERLVDVGVFRRWIYMDNAMRDFDIVE